MYCLERAIGPQNALHLRFMNLAVGVWRRPFIVHALRFPSLRSWGSCVRTYGCRAYRACV